MNAAGAAGTKTDDGMPSGWLRREKERKRAKKKKKKGKTGRRDIIYMYTNISYCINQRTRYNYKHEHNGMSIIAHIPTICCFTITVCACVTCDLVWCTARSTDKHGIQKKKKKEQILFFFLFSFFIKF